MTVGASCTAALMTTLVERLVSDATFAAACPGGLLLGAAQRGTPKPYARMTLREDPSSVETFSRMGFEVMGLVTIWSAYDGGAQIEAVRARLAALLHHWTPVPDGWVVTLVHYLGGAELSDTTDLDGHVLHVGNARFRALVQAA